MADRIQELANSAEEIRAQVQEGLEETLDALGENIPENFKTTVDLITATAMEYSTKLEDVSQSHKITFTLFGGGAGVLADSIFNFGFSDDPWPKALAKAVVICQPHMVQRVRRHIESFDCFATNAFPLPSV